MESIVFLCYGLKAMLKTEHKRLKLKKLDQTHLPSNLVYLNKGSSLGPLLFLKFVITCQIA